MLHALYEVNIIMNTITDEEIDKLMEEINHLLNENKHIENCCASINYPYEEGTIEYHQIATKQANQQS